MPCRLPCQRYMDVDSRFEGAAMESFDGGEYEPTVSRESFMAPMSRPIPQMPQLGWFPGAQVPRLAVLPREPTPSIPSTPRFKGTPVPEPISTVLPARPPSTFPPPSPPLTLSPSTNSGQIVNPFVPVSTPRSPFPVPVPPSTPRFPSDQELQLLPEGERQYWETLRNNPEALNRPGFRPGFRLPGLPGPNLRNMPMESYEYDPTVSSEMYTNGNDPEAKCNCGPMNRAYRMESCGYNQSPTWDSHRAFQNNDQPATVESYNGDCGCGTKNRSYRQEQCEYNQSPTWGDQTSFRNTLQDRPF